MRIFAIAGLIAAGISGSAQAETMKEFFPDVYESLNAQYQTEADGFDLQQGQVTLQGGMATLDIGPDYYFIDAKLAKLVVEEFWGNPEGQPLLGMIFPRDVSPYHQGGWGLTIEFEDIGYVSDEDANSYDYDDLLKTMQADTLANNAWRVENGYGTLELVGWAAPPRYDAEGRKLHWAKQLRFQDSDADTLNYNIRALGRRGVLVMNFIAGIDELPQVSAAVPDVLEMVSFTPGNTYADFVPGTDKVAAVGIGGLIAGKALAKTGFLVTLLLILKKAWFVLLIPLFWLKNKFFGRKNDQDMS